MRALDQIATAQGCVPGAGHFTEGDVRAMFSKTVNERQKTFRDRKRAAGWVKRGINLPPDAQAALAAIRTRDGVTADEAVRQALLHWAGGR